MNDLNKALMESIDKIDTVRFASEMQVLSEMTVYYEKCVKLVGYADENSTVVEELGMFSESYIITEASIKDKLKTTGQKIGNSINATVDKADQWSKSPTSGGRIKKIVFGLVKGITAIIVKIIKMIKFIGNGIKKLFNHDIDKTIKTYDDYLDDAINKFTGSFNESYVIDNNDEILQEAVIEAVATQVLGKEILNYVAKQGMKAAVDKITDGDEELIPVFAKKDKEQLAIRIRKIDRMSKEQKAMLIKRSNKIINAYCTKANNVSEKVVDAICTSIIKQVEKKHPDESAEEMFDRLETYINKVNKTVIAAMKGLISGTKTALNVATDVAKAVGVDKAGLAAAKALAVLGGSSIKMCKYTKELANSEAIGNQTAKAIVEIATKKDLLARTIKTARDFLSDKPSSFKEKEEKKRDEEYKASLTRTDYRASHKISDIQIMNQHTLTDIEKASDEITVFLRKKLKVLTPYDYEKLATQDKLFSEKIESLNREEAHRDASMNMETRYHIKNMEVIDSMEDRPDIDKDALREKYIKLHVEEMREIDEICDMFVKQIEEDAKYGWVTVNEEDFSPECLRAYKAHVKAHNELVDLLEAIFDKDKRDHLKGMKASEAIIKIAELTKAKNKAFLQYLAESAKTINANIIRLESIQGSLAELGELVQKFGDAVLTTDEKNRQILTDEYGSSSRSIEYELTSALNKFVGRVCKAAGFCMTKCVTNPTACKKLMDKTVAEALRSSAASLENKMVEKDIDERNKIGDEE